MAQARSWIPDYHGLVMVADLGQAARSESDVGTLSRSGHRTVRPGGWARTVTVTTTVADRVAFLVTVKRTFSLDGTGTGKPPCQNRPLRNLNR